MISDAENEVIFYREILCEQMADAGYTDIDVNIRLSTRKSYFLTVNLFSDDEGTLPTVMVCDRKEYVPENQKFFCGGEERSEQLVTRYVYSDAIPAWKIKEAVFLFAVTSFLIAVPRIKNKWLRRIGGIILLLLLPVFLGQRLEEMVVYKSIVLPNAISWNMAIMYLLELILLLCTGSAYGTVIVTDIILILLYSVNYYVTLYRGTPMKIYELKAAGTAAKVVGSFDLTPGGDLAVCWGIALFLAAAAWKCRGELLKKKRFGRKHLIWRFSGVVVGVVLAVYSGYLLTMTDFLKQNGFMDIVGLGSSSMYRMNGYLVTTCIEVNRYHIKKPEGYSVHKVEEILEEYAEQSEEGINTEEFPHMILILNESFADLRVLRDLKLSRENMDFFYSLKENTVTGYVNASSMGGGTSNSEFEVLTGCSMGFLPRDYYVYEERLKHASGSLVSLLGQYEYTTVSMHPESSGNYNRKMVYGNYGFDISLWKEDFKGAEVIHSGTSDLETYRRIEEIYENREPGEKLFFFDLTMQNHGGYGIGDIAYEVTAEDYNMSELDEFLSLIDISDKAFQELIAYFERQDEKVIICMFGDHQPMIWSGPPETIVSGADLNFYKTPFVIWANYDIPEQEGLDISMNYLGALLVKTAGINESAFQQYLLQLMEKYPVITANGYIDRDGVFYQWSGNEDEFLEYRMLQYNYLFDSKTVDWGFGL